MNAQDFLKNKTAGFYFFAIACVAALASAVVYVVRNGDSFTTTTPAVTALLVVGVVLSVLLSIKDIKPLEIIPFVLYLAAFLVFIDTEVNFMANVAMGIDGNAVDPAFIAYAALNIIAVVTGMVAAIMEIQKD